ncbi:MAG: hypothetical protein JSV90_06225 [Methanobacteriota archaeon]|nr:MAG: hypothetical protein JSV90_06225 [Euryarchaeota archaeon]
MCLLVVLQSPVSADIASPGSPRYANNMFSDFVTPTIAPGDSLTFEFNLTNPYDDPSAEMHNVTVTVGIYRYATQEEVRDVDDDFDNPPLFDNGSPERVVELEALELGETERIALDISTKRSTPHGSYFMQSTYFVRLSLEFNFEANNTTVALKSKGFFTDEQWSEMVSFSPEDSIVNVTYMNELGVDGLIPDSSFGLKIPIPRWPLALLVAGCGGTAFLALYYFVLDNPGRYPGLEKRFYQLRGKLSKFRSKLENFRRKG